MTGDTSSFAIETEDNQTSSEANNGFFEEEEIVEGSLGNTTHHDRFRRWHLAHVIRRNPRRSVFRGC